MCLKKRKASVIMKSTTRLTTRKLQSVYERERERKREREKEKTDRAKNTTFTEEIV